MIQAKIAVLEKVIKQVEKEGTITERYVDSNGCMCAVGHIFSECGVDMDMFHEDYALNGEFPSRLLSDREIFEAMEDHGFTGEELDSLQDLNDSFEDDEEERAYNVASYLKDMVKELKRA